MHLFHKRPLLLAMSCFLLFCTGAAFTTQYVRTVLLITFASLTTVSGIIAAIAALQKRAAARMLSHLFLCLLFCGIAVLSSSRFFDNKLSMLENIHTPVKIVAEVRECTYSAAYLSEYTVAVHEMDGQKVNFKASLTIDGAADLLAGNVIETEATFHPFETAHNGYNERANSIANGILVGGTFTDFEILKENSGSVWCSLNNLRNTISRRIDKSDADSAGMLKALLLGDRGDLPDPLSLDFRRLGISHILSISGTHFTTLLGMMLLLLSAFRVNKRVSYALMIPLALFYMALTGFSPSVCRAGIMAILAYIGILSGRVRDSYTALFAAVTGILLVQPYTVYSIGLWLSFFATFAILILLDLMNILEKAAKAILWKKLLYYIFSRILITVFVSFVTLPIIAVTFGELSLLAPIGNLLIVPLFSLFLYLAPFTVLFANLPPIIALTDILYNWILQAVDALCRADNLLISLRPPFVPYIAAAGCIATLILLALPLKRRGFVLLPSGISILAITVTLGIFMHLHSSIAKITYFTYKESDGIVVTDQNRSLYIDISNGSASPAYKGTYIAEENYSAELSGILFTHYHNAHISTLHKLANSVNIHAIYLPYTENEEAQNHMYALQEAANTRGIPVVWFAYDEPITFAGSTITVYTPAYLSRSTHPVVSLSINVKGTDVLYLGSSFNDTTHDFTDEAAKAEYILYGQHHPTVKNPYSVASDAYPVYGDTDRIQYSEDKRPGFLIDGEEGSYSLTLK